MEWPRSLSKGMMLMLRCEGGAEKPCEEAGGPLCQGEHQGEDQCREKGCWGRHSKKGHGLKAKTGSIRAFGAVCKHVHLSQCDSRPLEDPGQDPAMPDSELSW